VVPQESTRQAGSSIYLTMTSRAVPTLFSLLVSVAAFAEPGGESAARVQVGDSHRYLEPGSWMVTETRQRSGDAHVAAAKQKVLVVAGGEAGGGRAILESRWVVDGFEPAGSARPLGGVDPRSFDVRYPKPRGVQPDGVVTIGPKRYVCRVETHEFRDATTGRSTVLTLWRDKSGGTQLPPRSVSINGGEIPLPADALQAEVAADGPEGSTRSHRRVVSLASPLRVSGRTLSCVVESTETRGTRGGKRVGISVQEWFCHDLPGERLRVITCGTAGGGEVQTETTVVDFHVAKPAGGSGATAAGDGGGTPTILPSAE
jgi:hypothetical protein